VALSSVEEPGTPLAAVKPNELAKLWGTVGLGAIADFAGRLGGFVQEMEGEASGRQIHGTRMHNLRNLRDESHHRFPPDYFNPGQLEVRDRSWSDGDVHRIISHLPRELQRLLKAFRHVEDTLDSAVDHLDSLADSDPEEVYNSANHTAGGWLHDVHVELLSALAENVSIVCSIAQAR
jgi:hypothetical protein